VNPCDSGCHSGDKCPMCHFPNAPRFAYPASPIASAIVRSSGGNPHRAHGRTTDRPIPNRIGYRPVANPSRVGEHIGLT